VTRTIAAFLILAALALPAAGQVAFTEAETRALLSHGPWPVPHKADPSNRVSGKREAIELGERLFFERRMSGNGKFSCGTCHVPERNWTDNLQRGAAAAVVDRNTPTLMNARLGRWFGWDGAADSLWAQSLRPILDQRELGASARHVAELMRNDAQLACRYRRTFGNAPSPSDDEAVFVDVGKALAAFQETFETPPTPFDRFRDALARGEPVHLIYSEAAQRGARLFVGKGTCNTCHSGPNFTNGEFRDNGFSALAPQGRAEPGRSEGLKRVRENHFNLAGRYNDNKAPGASESARRALQGEGGDRGFKVPTLRHLFLTAPYGHHGNVATMADAVRHYSERGSRDLKPLQLTAAEQSDLVVFLQTISTFNNPWRPDDLNLCH
jgi:cytochrome c peroxidase